MRKYIGIDVGKMGGICVMAADGKIEALYKMPVMGKEYDGREIARIIQSLDIKNEVHVAIEDVHAVQTSGRTGSFQFGLGKGILIGIVDALNVPYTLVGAKTWQKICWEGVPRQKDTKTTSLIAAKRLFPDESFLPTQRSTTPHDGLVDATLIANYIRLKHESKL